MACGLPAGVLGVSRIACSLPAWALHLGRPGVPRPSGAVDRLSCGQRSVHGSLDFMDKVYEWTTPEEAARAEGAHWRSRSIEERVSAIEAIRRATAGIYGDAPARLERVWRFVELPPRARPARGSTRTGGEP